MINREKDIIQHVSTAIFIAVFALLMAAFSHKSVKVTIDNPAQNEISAQFHTHSVKAVAINAAKLPAFHKSWVSVLDKMNFNLFNETFKISADNQTFTQQFTLLHKKHCLIKPVLIQRFNNHLSQKAPEELPVLS